MKKSRHFCLILVFLILFCQIAFPISAQVVDSDTAITQGCHTIDGQVPVLGTGPLIENVQSVLLYERTTDTLMYAWNADQQVYPASLVKIMTALLVVENANLTDIVTVSSQVIDAVPEGAATAELQENEVLTVGDLLYCMMVGSANDAAVVLAEHISGSQEAFVQLMNNRATELGCKDTVFLDPNGLNSEQHSTARDIGRILAESMRNEAFETIFCSAEYKVPATNKSEERVLETSNLLMDPDSALYYDPRVTGGRTGTGESGEKCIATTAQSDQLKMIGVVIGAKSVYKEDGYTVTTIGGFNETKFLLDSSLAGFKPAQILYDGQALKQYRVTDADTDLIVGPKVSISTVLPAEMMLSGLSYRYQDSADGFRAPVEKGQKVSVIEIWNGSVCVAHADLFAMNRVALKEDTTVSVDDAHQQRVFPVILWCVLGVLVTVVAVILAMRFISLAKMQAVRRRTRRNRRRSR